MRVGLFIDTWYPMVDGVIKVVDNYAKRLTQYCDVTVFCTEAKGYDPEEDSKFPYRIVRCGSLPLMNYDYTLPTAILDPKFDTLLPFHCRRLWGPSRQAPRHSRSRNPSFPV